MEWIPKIGQIDQIGLTSVSGVRRIDAHGKALSTAAGGYIGAVGSDSPSATPPFAAVAFLCLVYAVAIRTDSAALAAGAVASSPVGHRGTTLAMHSTLGGGSLFASALVGAVLDVAAPLGGQTA